MVANLIFSVVLLLLMWSFVVFPKMVVVLLVHLDVIDDNVESISSDRTCGSISFDRTGC